MDKSVFIKIGKQMLSTNNENNELKNSYKNIICEGICEFNKKKLEIEIKKLDEEIIYLLIKNNNLKNNLKNKFILEQYKLNELTITRLKSLRENYLQIVINFMI